MNKLIRELAEQADAMDMAENELTGDTYCLNQIALKKFAELIVRECARAIIADSRLSDVRSAANGCVRTINEHFGIE